MKEYMKLMGEIDMKKSLIVVASAALLLSGCATTRPDTKTVEPSVEASVEATVEPSVESTVEATKEATAEPTAEVKATAPAAAPAPAAKPADKPKAQPQTQPKPKANHSKAKASAPKAARQDNGAAKRKADAERARAAEAKRKAEEQRKAEERRRAAEAKRKADEEAKRNRPLNDKLNAGTETARLYSLAAGAGIPRATNFEYCGKIGHVLSSDGADGLWGSRAHKAIITSPVHRLWIKKSWVVKEQHNDGILWVYHADIWGCDP